LEKEGKSGTARDIVEFILIRSFLSSGSSGWSVKSLNSLNFKDPLSTPINLELSSSNTYNALIEVSILTNSIIIIDYDLFNIDGNLKNIEDRKPSFGFIDRNDPKFKTNYLLAPEVNLQSLSLNYSNEGFYPILYVLGGEDESGIVVTMIPELSYQNYLDIKNFFENYYQSFVVVNNIKSFILKYPIYKNNGFSNISDSITVTIDDIPYTGVITILPDRKEILLKNVIEDITGSTVKVFYKPAIEASSYITNNLKFFNELSPGGDFK
jgi:hypothetical protein